MLLRRLTTMTSSRLCLMSSAPIPSLLVCLLIFCVCFCVILGSLSGYFVDASLSWSCSFVIFALELLFVILRWFYVLSLICCHFLVLWEAGPLPVLLTMSIPLATAFL